MGFKRRAWWTGGAGNLRCLIWVGMEWWASLGGIPPHRLDDVATRVEPC